VDLQIIFPRTILLLASAIIASITATGRAQSAAPLAAPVPWPAVDALGRSLPGPAEVGAPRTDRFVGIFYFLWHTPRGREGKMTGPRDISKILAEDPQALQHPDSPLWGPLGMPHYWGEPLYGYYRSDDPWVLRRHAQLLSAAGIDTLIFDTTNAVPYPEVYRALCEMFTQVRREGGRTPQIAFMVNTKAGETADRIYHDLYEMGLYRDLWFIWQGKPLLICDPAQASPQVKSFFTLRAAHWPFTLVNTSYAWHWESIYPQVYGYTDDPNRPEQVNVAVAQNLRASDGKVTNMSAGNARGRSFHDGKEDRTPGAVDHGYNFAEQWKRAIELDPPFVMVTGWNEWIAGRFGQPGKSVVFVDQYNEEFSRDIEPMKGGHGDNYYYQLAANVRRYKGCPPIPAASQPKTIDIAGAFEQWKDVKPEFWDDVGDTAPRDHDGIAGLHYADHSGRNDLVAMKVARDQKNVFFYVRTREPITRRTDANWMRLLIDADGNLSNGWEGYDFIVNRSIEDDHTAWLEKSLGGWKWEKVAKIDYRVAGNELQLSIPRAALGLKDGPISLNFKWSDNLQHSGDIMDFYISGDVAPEGRFMYRYQSR
jgi:hypothetical protein